MRKLFFTLSLVLLAAFHDNVAVGETRPPKPSRPRIEWQTNTLSLLHSNAYYGRIIRHGSGQLIAGYEHRRRIWVRHSRDEGRTWETPVQVADWEEGRLTNAELLSLTDGTLLCFYNERPRHKFDPTNNSPINPPYSIAMARSTDAGQTWGPSERLFSAGREFTNGCWEPAAIQLSSGEVQLFFSNEGPYRDSDEQEITLLRSLDNGRSWSAPETVSFRPRARDGMPVPVVLRNGGGIAFAIEDNGLSGNFKPVIVFSSLEDNWRSGVRGPESTNRWSALRELPPPHVAASAPYLRQMPSGETVLSFQRSETGELAHAYMMVCVGDERARDFTNASRPFPVTEGKAQLWNSLFVKNKDAVVAVSEATINGQQGIWMIEGRLVR